MPTGYVTAVAIIALYTLLILRAPRRPAALARVTFLMTHWVNEYPLIAFAALAVSTVIALAQGDLTSGGGWAVLGVAALTALGLLHAIRRASLAGEVVTRTLADQLGVLPQGDGAQEDPTPWNARRVLRDVVAPFPARPRDVRRISDIPYGDAGRRNLMDLYLRRDPPGEPRPVLIHFHGGHFQIGARAARRCRCSTGWRVTAGCASAPTTASVPRDDSRTRDRREVGDRMGTHACRGTRRRSVPDRRRGRVGGRPPRVDGGAHPQPSRRSSHPAPMRWTPPSPPPSACTGTTVRERRASPAPHPRTTSRPRPRRSSSPPATTTTRSTWATPTGSSSGCAGSQPRRSSTSACPELSTRSTCSGRCASTTSSTESWPSWNGFPAAPGGSLSVRLPERAAAASSPDGRSGTCSRWGSARDSPGARARPPRRGRRAPPR